MDALKSIPAWMSCQLVVSSYLVLDSTALTFFDSQLFTMQTRKREFLTQKELKHRLFPHIYIHIFYA